MLNVCAYFFIARDVLEFFQLPHYPLSTSAVSLMEDIKESEVHNAAGIKGFLGGFVYRGGTVMTRGLKHFVSSFLPHSDFA